MEFLRMNDSTGGISHGSDPHGPSAMSMAGSQQLSQLARVARGILQRRRQREKHLPGHLFAEPAWDILLDLFAADIEGISVSVTSACLAANVPATTAQRYLRALQQERLIARVSDPQDKRRTFVAITPLGRAALGEWLLNLGI